MNPLFPIGRTIITPGARDSVCADDVAAGIVRHVRGDWGSVCDDDRRANDDAVLSLARIVSAYVDRAGTKFWIITEADRSQTTILLPDEY